MLKEVLVEWISSSLSHILPKDSIKCKFVKSQDLTSLWKTFQDILLFVKSEKPFQDETLDFDHTLELNPEISMLHVSLKNTYFLRILF